MKNIYLLIAFLMCGFSVLAQDETNTEGTITYEQVMKLDIQLDGDAGGFADMLPKERKSQKSLHFTHESSLYQKLESEEDDAISMEQGGANVMIKMEEPENIIFTNMEDGNQIEQREFMTRVFLIEGATKNKWKITGKQKTILDYPCQEAELDGAEDKTVAWFTPMIPVSAGPGQYVGLPGMILAVDINDGENTITATSVKMGNLEKGEIIKPKKGKKVSREEFDQIVKEKMEEMGAEQGKGGNQFIIHIKQ